jgi:hypothetical protein
MKADRFDEDFEDTDWSAHQRWPAESRDRPSPALGRNREPDYSSESESESVSDYFGEPEFQPDIYGDYGDDPELEPEPEPHELWPRTEDGSEEEPAVQTPAATRALPEASGAAQTGDRVAGQSRHQKAKSPFIKGPLCREWIVRAGELRNSALKVAMPLWFKAGVQKDDFIRGRRAESALIRFDRALKKRFRISPSQMSRGLHALEEAGLIRILKGGAGRCPEVSIVNVQIP